MANEETSITMKDIARAIGVSVATVSRALKDNPRISKEKRSRLRLLQKPMTSLPTSLPKVFVR